MSWYWIILIVLLLIVALYLFAIMPRVSKKEEAAKLCKGNFAHRGLHDNKSEAPENSMLSFKRAVESGYGIEFDVQLTKDEKVVVFHDETLLRVCKQEGNVRDYTYEELQKFSLCESEEKIPLLKDVLNVVDGKVPLIVEVKIHENVDKVCSKVNEILSTYKGVYVVESFHPFAVGWYKKNRPDVIRGQLSSNIAKDQGKWTPSYCMVRHLLMNFIARPDFIAYCHKYANATSLNLACKMFGAAPVTWTIKSQEELNASKRVFNAYIFEGFIPEE